MRRARPSIRGIDGSAERQARKHGSPERRIWRKIHLGIDEETLKIRAVEITGSHIGDAPVLPDLLGQIPISEEISSVTADGAYDTRKCHDAIVDRGAHAVIPPRKTAKPWQTAPPVPPRETRSCAPPNIPAWPCGDDGAETTAKAASKRRRTV